MIAATIDRIDSKGNIREHKLHDDAGCAGCLTASAAHPCLGHGCTAWCHQHYAAAFAKTKCGLELDVTQPASGNRKCRRCFSASEAK